MGHHMHFHRGRIPVTPESVVKVLGVPMVSSPVPYHQNVDATCVVLKMFGIHNGVHPKVATVEKELGPDKPADEAYLRKFVIYLNTSIFVPTTGIKVSPKCYPSVVNAQEISRLNWARFIIDVLCQTANMKDKKNWFKACMPYLMIMYIDSLEIDDVNVPQDGTRCAVWTNKMISTVAALDTHSDGTFGALPDLAKYRHAVINICTVFEDGLASFIKSMVDDKGTTAKQIEPEARLITKPKRKRITRAVTEKAQGGKPQEDHQEDKLPMPESDPVAASTTGDEGARTLDAVQIDVEDKLKKRNFVANEAVAQIVVEASIKPTYVEPEPATVARSAGHVSGSSASNGSSNALNQLQHIYGSSSQLTSDTTSKEGSVQHPSSIQHSLFHAQSHHGTCNTEDLEGASTAKKRKKVTFAEQGEGNQGNSSPPCNEVAFNEPTPSSPTVRRPVTRSMSPVKTPGIPDASLKHKVRESKNFATPKRLTRFAAEQAMATHSKVDMSDKEAGSETANNCMKRNLELEFGNSPALVETESQRKRRELIEDCPSFDLGFETQGSQPNSNVTASDAIDPKQEEIVVISSNEESGDSLDKIYATIEIPVRTPGNEKKTITEDHIVTSVGPSSCTPIPEAHKKRVVKATMNQKSPFVEYDKKQVASKFAAEVYNRVCAYGGDTEDAFNEEKIIDYDSFFIYLWDLADSVREGKWLSNSTCQIALHILSVEMAEQKKHVMPIRMADKLRNPNCIHDRFVKKAFKITPECRLDHKEQICFPVLQDLTPDLKEFNGHYYLIVLNLKAERFEVMDSLRAKGNRGLIKDVRNIVGSIKGLWAANYNESKINIEKWPTEHIDTPKQKTSYDCGYFMLKFIELWNGRKLLGGINPDDMPTIRKQMTLKWLQWGVNKVSWQELLF